MWMSNLIRGSEDESCGPAPAAHSRIQERYYKIIPRTDRSGLAQSEFASGDLSQIDKHLLVPGGHSVGSVCWPCCVKSLSNDPKDGYDFYSCTVTW